MNTLLTVLVVIASIVLILVVLVQKSKGGGLSSNFSSSNAIMGVRKTTDFIEKATWGLAAFIIVLSIVCVMVRPKAPVGTDIVPANPITNQPLPEFPTGGIPEEVPAENAGTLPTPMPSPENQAN